MDERAILHWHPRYDVAAAAEDRIVLTDESTSVLLQGDHYQRLFAQIDGTHSTMDILATVADIGTQVTLLTHIDRLLAEGICIEGTPSQHPALYHRPDFYAAPVTVQGANPDLHLTLLSQFANHELFVQWTQALHVRRPTHVVMVDDYLDPRLEAINRRHLHQQRPWLLIKPTGHQPFVGPYLLSGEPEPPCWACVATRLRRNQPVRLWLQGDPQADPRPVPIHYDADAVRRTLAMAVMPAQHLLDGQLKGCVCSLNLQDGWWEQHAVHHRPQCPACGDPYLFTQNSSVGVVLHASPKVYTQDGGFRSRTPQQTLAALADIHNPLTGVVRDVSVLPGQPQGGITIYRSSFCKTPWGRPRFEPDDFLHVALGKGISAEQSRLSALCEALERYAAQYQGDEPQRLSQASQLDARALEPQTLAPFSAQQYAQFADPQHPEYRSRQAVAPCSAQMPLHWTLGRSLSRDEPVYVPLTYCYTNTPFADEHYVRWNSNGCAAGNTLEEAVLQGFLELLERDAVAIWWYNKVPRPAVALHSLPDAHLGPIRATLDAEWAYWVLDLTHDFRIPVMAAIGQHRQTHTYRLGFGCHLAPELACLRALTELCQLIAIQEQGATAFDFSRIASEAYMLPADDVPVTAMADFDVVDHADIRHDVHFCIERAAQLALETIVVNYTRPDLPIHTVKVIVPGLCHIWPRLGAERLYAVSVTPGWRASRLLEQQLNPIPLFL